MPPSAMPPSATPPCPERYRIGIDAMDEQHARWIFLIEQFRAVGTNHLLEPAGVDAARLALEKLLEYTRLHFSSEERLLEKHHYPGLAAHRQAHHKLVTAVTELLEELRAQVTRTAPLKLNLLATIWLMEHIIQEDRKYAQYILGKTQGEKS